MVTRRYQASSSSSAGSRGDGRVDALARAGGARAAAVSVAVLFFPSRIGGARVAVRGALVPAARRHARRPGAVEIRRGSGAVARRRCGGGRPGGVVEREGRRVRGRGDGDRPAHDRHPVTVHVAAVGAGGRSGGGRPSRIDAASAEERSGLTDQQRPEPALDLAKQTGSKSDEEQAGSVGTVGFAGATGPAAGGGSAAAGSVGTVATVGTAGDRRRSRPLVHAAAGAAGTVSSIGSTEPMGTGTAAGGHLDDARRP